MTRRTRQLTAFILAIALTFSLLPTAVWATNSTGSEPAAAVAEERTDPASGGGADGGGESPSAETPQALTAKTEETTTEEQEAASKAKQQDGGTSGGEDSGLSTFSGVLTTSSYDPNVTLSTADGVQAGRIRYITQQKKNPYYQASQWGSYSGSAIKYCWAACISMSLSYLGINKLPKTILGAGKSEKVSPTLEWGAEYLECDTLAEAVDNYVNGNGAYSPPVISWEGSCYGTNKHVLLAIGRKSDNVYQVTDPLENSSANNFVRQITVNGAKAKSTKLSTGSKTVYTFNITRIYQYYQKSDTTLKNGALQLDGGILKENTPLTVQGHIGGSEHINSVTAGCYDLRGNPVKNCNETVTVDSVGYDLSEMNQKLQFSKLQPGFYEYRVSVKLANRKTEVLHSQKFAVRNGKKNLPNATFYFDNGKSIKYCVTAPSSAKNSVLKMSRNTERDTMKIRAQAVGSNGYYRLMVEDTGMYLTVYKSSSQSGTKVIQYPKVDKNGQYWQILPAEKSGYYYLMPKCAPTCCLSVAKDAVESGTLEIRTAKPGAAQYWLLRYTRPLISNVRNVASGIQVKWDAPAYATGYEISRATGSSDSWKQVEEVKDGKASTWVDTKVTNGTKYRYKVRALYGSQKSPLTPEGHRYRVTRPGTMHLKSTAAKKLTATWSVNHKATGYQLCYSTNKSFSKSKTLTISGGSTKTKTITGLSRGKMYYVKVRACKKVGQNYYYSAWTGVKAVLVK